uniref:Penaeidin-3e n=1 Tax=Penaeus vannamei TaxID=6689 RepID=PEN3E_PENVA|nr:RecName: Full=Penaeidin-3e; Short=Pen-3e; Flags: Precursor [Penaeus vannamei]AAK77534.1 penaeidin 3e [Penaeus vannamei]
MRLVVCLVFLAPFALVCHGQVYKGGYTRPIPRPPPFVRPLPGGPIGPYNGCPVSCRGISFSQARSCCSRLGRCCHVGKGYSG